MNILKIILTSLLSVTSIFLITKIMGHKQVAQLDFFDYVSGITIGSIAAELATNLEAPYNPLIALTVYGFVSVLLAFVTNKIPRSRKFINGSPTILMNDGKLYRKNLKQAKLDLSEFMLLCREQGFFDLGEIKTAVFEHNGKLSILPQATCRPITPNDLKIPVKATHIGTEIIMDGRIMGDNLSRLGLDEKWLADELKAQDIKSPKSVFLAIYYGEEKKLCIYLDN